jgi:hypothetical protein
MSQTEITYEDKTENGGITPEGLVGASDLNDVKQVVNANSIDAESRMTANTEASAIGKTLVEVTAYTVLVTDRNILVDDTTAGGIVTITVPAFAEGSEFSIKKIGTDFDVIIAPAGTIDGVATRTLHQKNDALVIFSDGPDYEIKSRNVVLGWANYVDNEWSEGSPLTLAADVPMKLTINGLGAGTTVAEWPDGVTQPWDTSTDKLIATNDGDKFTYRLQYAALDGSLATQVDTFIDIGGSVGEISRRSTSVAKGSVQTNVEIFSSYFTGSTFVANGGTIYLVTEATTMDIWDVRLTVEKTHVAS